MNKFASSALHALTLIASATLPGPAASATITGTTAFTAEGRTYLGEYSAGNQFLSVTIDGLTYRGHYAARADDLAVASNGIAAGRWGRAFLFASSAKVLQCQLDSGFPQVSGNCKAADGRTFELKPGAIQRTSGVTPRAANP